MGCGNSKGIRMDEQPHSPTGNSPTTPLAARQRAPRASLISSYTKVEIAKSPARSVESPSGTTSPPVPAAGPRARLHYAYVSQRGYYPDQPDKANQDAVCVVERLGGDASTHLLGVLDGHGEFGAEAAFTACDKLAEHLALDPAGLASDPSSALHAAMLAANQELHASDIDDSLSGTTACVALIQGCNVIVGNVGDSRAVLAEAPIAAEGSTIGGNNRSGRLCALDLSWDQTPFRADEAARVRKAGARVLTLDQLEGIKDPAAQCWTNEDDCDGDPPRLWSPHGMYPGTAFTRSLGDAAAEDIGVIADPELHLVRLGPRARFLILATDGVWEFLGSQQAVDMVAQCRTPAEGARLLVAAAYKAWLQHETRTDDISAVVAFFEEFDPGFGEDLPAKPLAATPQPCASFKCVASAGAVSAYC